MLGAMQNLFFHLKKYLAASIIGVGAIVLSVSASASEAVGTVSFVIGDANTLIDAKNNQAIVRGDKLQQGQVVLTGSNGHVHIKMIDGAFVSIRPMSRFRIEEYKYDAAEPKNSRIKFVLEQGTARSITGKAGEASKQSFRLNTPLAAIGIRGTDFVVHTERDVTRVVVQSGAIVMTPLNEDCLSSTFGPCNNSTARVLTAAMRDAYLELRSKKDAPILVPAEKSLNSPNLTSPPRPEEPVADRGEKSGSASVSRISQDVNQAVTVTTIKTQIDSLANTPKPVDKPVVEPVEPVVPAKIWWGRWEPVVGGSGSTGNPALAPDREVTMSNVVFGMLREKGDAYVPNSGVAKFKLADSESYLMAADKTLTAGRVSDTNLVIDFANRKFDTSLVVNVNGFAPTEIRASGDVSFQGLFMTETTSPDTIVAGSLSKNGDQAGYLFQRNTGNGLIIGATRWIQ
jgi:hypothetical protein